MAGEDATERGCVVVSRRSIVGTIVIGSAALAMLVAIIGTSKPSGSNLRDSDKRISGTSVALQAAGAANQIQMDHVDVGNAVGGWGPDAEAIVDWKVLAESGAWEVDGKEKNAWSTHFGIAHEVVDNIGGLMETSVLSVDFLTANTVGAPPGDIQILSMGFDTANAVVDDVGALMESGVMSVDFLTANTVGAPPGDIQILSMDFATANTVGAPPGGIQILSMDFATANTVGAPPGGIQILSMDFATANTVGAPPGGIQILSMDFATANTVGAPPGDIQILSMEFSTVDAPPAGEITESMNERTPLESQSLSFSFDFST